MNPIKFLAISLLVALTLSSGLGMAMAEERFSSDPSLQPVFQASPGFIGPNNNLTDADLETFVDLAFKEQITVAQTEAIYESLTPDQKEQVSDLVAIRAGIPLLEWRESRTAISSLGADVLDGEIWRQFIEHAWVWPPPPGTTYPSSYWVEKYCEGGSNPDPDDDWVFYFPMSYSQNPDGLRWTTASSQVYLAFQAAYGGNLNGYAYNWSEVRLCLGVIGVSAAGGPWNVALTTFLSPNH